MEAPHVFKSRRASSDRRSRRGSIDGSPVLIERSEHLPARAGLAKRTRQRIASVNAFSFTRS
jgi:hypothetical protein